MCLVDNTFKRLFPDNGALEQVLTSAFVNFHLDSGDIEVRYHKAGYGIAVAFENESLFCRARYRP